MTTDHPLRQIRAVHDEHSPVVHQDPARAGRAAAADALIPAETAYPLPDRLALRITAAAGRDPQARERPVAGCRQARME